MQADPSNAVDLYWLPLGAGGHSVRYNGQAYEWLVARRERRSPLDLYHSALVIETAAGRFVVESGPVPRAPGAQRGVVAQGAVGHRSAALLRLGRYEVRCWLDGVIPDLAEAVDSPRRLSEDPAVTAELLTRVRRVPAPVWGRDELRTGDMWNSNSVIAWLLETSGVDAGAVEPPAGGRAPGWSAGVVVARREPC